MRQDMDTVCLVVSLLVMLAALMITVRFPSFIMGPVLLMLFANMFSGLLKILGNKMEYCNSKFSLSSISWTSFQVCPC